MAPPLRGGLSRRRIIQGAALAGFGLWQLSNSLPALAGTTPVAQTGATTATTALDPGTTMTLEAYADTIIPGEKRYATDVAIAGVASGPSGVVGGALDVLTMPEVGLVTVLPGLAMMLNGQAAGYAGAVGLTLDPTLPPFVALPFAHRTGLVSTLCTPGRPDHPYWVLLATLVSWAFDTAGAQHTVDALNTGHPGLAWINFPAPNADGLWRFPQFSYGRRLSRPSVNTCSDGSPV
jgi:hypothetical protein